MPHAKVTAGFTCHIRTEERYNINLQDIYIYIYIYIYICVCVCVCVCDLTFKRRIKSQLPFAGIIRSSPYSPRFQDKA